MMKMLLQLHAMLRFLVQCILFVGRTVGVRFVGCGMRSKWDINWQVVAWLHGFSFYCMVLHDASSHFIICFVFYFCGSQWAACVVNGTLIGRRLEAMTSYVHETVTRTP